MIIIETFASLFAQQWPVLGGDSIEKPRMRYFCGNPIVCHRREADCSDADGRHLSRAFRF